MSSTNQAHSEEELRILLDAEREARRLESEARALRDEMPGRIEAGKARIIAESESAAERAIADAREREKARADAEIDRIEADIASRLEKMKARFAAGREEYAARLFAIVTGQADE